MATYYWVGGSGSWNATSTTNWSDTSGGAGGAGVPTASDDVIFDAGSNISTSAFTVTLSGTISAPAVCRDFSTGGAGGALDGAMTLSWSATSYLDCHGSLTLPATNFTSSATAGATLRFKATTIGQTVTTNGTSLGTVNQIYDGVGGEWTLGSAFTASNGATFRNGTFKTSNYNLTVNSLASDGSGTAAAELGSSTVTLNSSIPINFTNSNFTLDAGTSTIICSAASPSFRGGGQAFYNVTFSSVSLSSPSITGANTYNNLTFTSRTSTGYTTLSINSTQIVNGTLTIGAANTAIRRWRVSSDVIGTQRTLTVATIATLSDVDFRSINAAGASISGGNWTGTRLGDLQGNSNITFDASKTVYWDLAGSQNWSATAWCTSPDGGATLNAPDANNFPLAQDTAVFNDVGSAGTVTFDVSWSLGTVDFSSRTVAVTLAGTASPSIYKNLTLSSAVTESGTGNFLFSGDNQTQIFTSAGVSFGKGLNLLCAPVNTVQLVGNYTTTSANGITVTNGVLDLNNNIATAVLLSSSNINVRSIAFGTGKIVLTGNATTIVLMAIADNFTYTGTSLIECSYSGSTGTRTIQFGSTSGATETNAPSVAITDGSDIVAVTTAFKNVNFTGFSGTLSNAARTIYGSLTVSSGMTLTAGGSATTFSATSGTQQITTNGNTLDFPLTFNGVGGTFAFQDALTQGSTRAFTITNGTVELKDGATSTVGVFATSGTNQKFLESTLAGTQATLSQASGTVNATNLTIKDINADGGATWNSYVNQGNIDAGNNDGWDFGLSPDVGGAEYTYSLRSFTQPRRF